MNGNSSKQVLLSVLGIAILVVAVVGVSFAFFSYTKQGTNLNTISTGQIYTYYNEDSTVSLTNAMPVANPESIRTTAQITAANTPNVTISDIGALEFTVNGINQSDTDIKYHVYLIKETPSPLPTGKTNGKVLDNSEIGIAMNSTGTGAITEITLASNKTMDDFDLASNADVMDLGEGTFAAHTTSQIQHAYTINMWVKNTVKISDTDPYVNGVATKYCASHQANATQTAPENPGCQLYDHSGTVNNTAQDGEMLPIYSDYYYSVRVKVVANTSTGAQNLAWNYDNANAWS